PASRSFAARPAPRAIAYEPDGAIEAVAFPSPLRGGVRGGGSAPSIFSMKQADSRTIPNPHPRSLPSRGREAKGPASRSYPYAIPLVQHPTPNPPVAVIAGLVERFGYLPNAPAAASVKTKQPLEEVHQAELA